MNLIRASNSKSSIRVENQFKFVEERLDLTESSLHDLQRSLDKFVRKSDKYGFSIGQLFKRRSDSQPNGRTVEDFIKFAAELTETMSTARNRSTDFISEEIIECMRNFNVKCKNHRTNLKHICRARDGETCTRRKSSQHSSRSQEISNLAQKSLETAALKFEREKLQTMKSVLEDFTKAELSFHANAVQTYSKLLARLSRIDVDSEFEFFKNALSASRRVANNVIVRQSDAVILRRQNVDRSIDDRVLGVSVEELLGTTSLSEMLDSEETAISEN
ncbi:DUF1208 [Nesidiocoris tenuis]|uniref:DUF1208 n=1 Tax=Nesidiocoris tenuis TaxID=355587 RepID=A0ABN7ARZ0_9HEMI|nr:DUF1208 [Nesidiocoris tenuis]